MLEATGILKSELRRPILGVARVNGRFLIMAERAPAMKTERLDSLVSKAPVTVAIQPGESLGVDVSRASHSRITVASHHPAFSDQL